LNGRRSLECGGAGYVGTLGGIVVVAALGGIDVTRGADRWTRRLDFDRFFMGLNSLNVVVCCVGSGPWKVAFRLTCSVSGKVSINQL